MVPEVVLELVSFYKNQMLLKRILEGLEVPSSTYHRWKNNPDLNTSLSDNEEARFIYVKKLNICTDILKLQHF